MAPTTGPCGDCGGSGVREPEPAPAVTVAQALAPTNPADRHLGGFAKVMHTPRTIVAAHPGRPRSRYGEIDKDGAVRFRGGRLVAPGEELRLRPDGAVVHTDGSIHDHAKVREAWRQGGDRHGEEDGQKLLLLEAFTEGPPLGWHEQEALLDYLSLGRSLDEELIGDPGHIDGEDLRDLHALRRQLDETIAARPLPAPMTVWWAPRPDLTGISRAERPEDLPEISWPAIMVCSVDRAPEAPGPIYKLKLPEGMPALWSVPEIGAGAGDHLLLQSGRRVCPGGIGAKVTIDGRGNLRETIPALVS